MVLIESGLEVDIGNIPKDIFTLMINLGYSDAILEIINPENLSEYFSRIQSQTSYFSNKFTLHLRKTLNDKGEKTLNKKVLDYWRFNCHFLVHECSSAEITKWAAQDQRLDALRFPPLYIHQLFDLSTARIMAENKKCLEITMKNFILSPTNQIKIFRNLLHVIKRAMNKEVPILFNSQIETIYDVVSPKSLIGLSAFLDLNPDFIFNFSQIHLKKILEKNISRLQSNYVAPGIKSLDDS
ncbi:MAG: hypothetical protein ACFFD1_14660 [Candidatus Thorarchaeota archaeon]